MITKKITPGKLGSVVIFATKSGGAALNTVLKTIAATFPLRVQQGSKRYRPARRRIAMAHAENIQIAEY
jgi:hypothetical protein